jgi:hypothetical protein
VVQESCPLGPWGNHARSAANPARVEPGRKAPPTTQLFGVERALISGAGDTSVRAVSGSTY